ncbi:MAG: VTT domain-containing protein [Candidatus Gracilibacteria bacterium]|jgi:uncharacterized membrane protein YdjX (TVP38/TMEM64 family)
MSKKIQVSLVAFLAFIFFAFVVPYLVFQEIPDREALQELIQGWGVWGFLLYFIITTITVIVVPLNSTLVGLAGGFVYGTLPAFLLTWVARIVATEINFFLGRRFGRNILKIFVEEEELHKYDELIESEKAVLFYFVLCSIPLLPGDYAAYFMGFSKLKKRVFVPVSILANAICAFSLAYIGSGAAFTDPLFLTIFTLLFFGGIFWIHKEKKKLKLG